MWRFRGLFLRHCFLPNVASQNVSWKGPGTYPFRAINLLIHNKGKQGKGHHDFQSGAFYCKGLLRRKAEKPQKKPQKNQLGKDYARSLKASRLGRLVETCKQAIPRNQKRSVAPISFHHLFKECDCRWMGWRGCRDEWMLCLPTEAWKARYDGPQPLVQRHESAWPCPTRRFKLVQKMCSESPNVLPFLHLEETTLHRTLVVFSRLFLAFCGFSLGKATLYVPAIQHRIVIVRPFSWTQKPKLQNLRKYCSTRMT